MDNQDILDRIQALVDEEHQLRASAPAGPPENADAVYDERRVRLLRVEEDLDQCWDLLRQRRAKENAGTDPNGALTRPTNEVEGYRQ